MRLLKRTVLSFLFSHLFVPLKDINICYSDLPEPGIKPTSLLQCRWILNPWATWEAKLPMRLVKTLRFNFFTQSSFLLLQSIGIQFSSVHLLSGFQLFATPWTRPPCPSSTPRVHPNSWALSRWCHPTISSSVVPFSSCPQSFPASGFFSNEPALCIRWPSIGVSASASVLPMNTLDWFPLGWTGCISLQSKGLSRVFYNTTVQNINSSTLSFLYSPTLTSMPDHWKNHSLD